ncbi:MAG: carboxypeptidase M32 [Saprospiraceae bacterium]
MSKIQKKYQDYVTIMQKRADVDYAIGLLSWDKETYMPEKGARFRSQQVATLSGISHEIFTDKKLGKTLVELNDKASKLDKRQAKNVKLSLKEYERSTKLSKEFVIKKSQTISKAFHAWVEARKANDFKVYKKELSAVVDICREEAELIGYKDHPYDALLDIYEPDAKTKDLTILFKDVREQLVDFVKELKDKSQVKDSFLYKKYDKDKQWEFGLKLLKNMGYDFEAGRQDLSEHPFTINFSPEDVRVTTRVDENDFMNMTWSCIHEGGHALYEQGLPSDQYGLPLGAYISLGIHESQSRLWENNVGRSLPYWKAHYKGLKKQFPKNLGAVSTKKFYKAINKIQPNLIRTEADELHYHFHVLIRFEMEKGLMEGTLKVDNLDEVWNAKYKEYLGVKVPDAKHGILQDIHWSHGSIGYFPTYSLGSFYAAQFFQQAEKEIPNLLEEIENGNNQPLLDWLRENTHQHGRYYNAEELCKKITGEKLNFKYFMKYARQKFGGIYGI